MARSRRQYGDLFGGWQAPVAREIRNSQSAWNRNLKKEKTRNYQRPEFGFGNLNLGFLSDFGFPARRARFSVAANRRILIQVTLPAVIIGALLLGTCLIGAWSINRLQNNRDLILSKNVRSLRKAQEMEIRLRQLHSHTFPYLIDPTPQRRTLVEEDHRQFEQALAESRQLASLPEEQKLIESVESGYRRYRAELDSLSRLHSPGLSRIDLLRWADTHPVRHLLTPCEELLRVNTQAMEETARESQAVGEQSQAVLIVLGVLGPAGGLLCGFGVAWGLSRSITRLRVHLRDATAHLDQELGSLQMRGEGDLRQLDQQMEQVVSRVREVVARSQQQQQEMLRAEQLAAVGQLAASMAHEVRNPLTSIKLLVSAALRSQPHRTLSPEDLQVIHNQVSRLEGKVQELLDFARPPDAVRETCDLRELVNHALDLVRARIQQFDIRLDVDLPERSVIAAVDRDQFTSVLINLFLNALDAMPHGGHLSITLGHTPRRDIRLAVADTGTGIDSAIAGRLFTPFASTKQTGTGLGLSICRRVIRDHGGTLTGENRLEGGALFTILLPVEVREVSHADATGD
jgi:two-component system, NtrC family, sensor histidine kinase HydH